MTTAFWCILAAALMPYACFGITVNRSRGSDGRRVRDNRNPRDFPNIIQGVAKRAWGAQLNSFEAFPLFAAAVIVAYLAHAPQPQIDILAVLWVVARIAYVAFYLGDRARLRSSVQFVSLACVLALFVVAGLAS